MVVVSLARPVSEHLERDLLVKYNVNVRCARSRVRNTPQSGDLGTLMLPQKSVIAAAQRALLLDVEATGLSPYTARIVSLACVEISARHTCSMAGTIVSDVDDMARQGDITWHEVDAFGTYVNPGAPIPKRVQELTRITDDDVRTAPTFASAWAAFTAWLRQRRGATTEENAVAGPPEPRHMSVAIMLAHNGIAYDWQLLASELRRSANPVSLDNDTVTRHRAGKVLAAALEEAGVAACVDTLAVCRGWDAPRGRKGTLRLGDLYAAATGEELHGAHSALADARALGAVFLRHEKNYAAMVRQCAAAEAGTWKRAPCALAPSALGDRLDERHAAWKVKQNAPAAAADARGKRTRAAGIAAVQKSQVAPPPGARGISITARYSALHRAFDEIDRDIKWEATKHLPRTHPTFVRCSACKNTVSLYFVVDKVCSACRVARPVDTNGKV